MHKKLPIYTFFFNSQISSVARVVENQNTKIQKAIFFHLNHIHRMNDILTTRRKSETINGVLSLKIHSNQYLLSF
jgi:hypothetical protein